jgi:hypothetical protein
MFPRNRLLPLTRHDLQDLMKKKATQEPQEVPLKSLGPFCTNGKTGRKIFVYPLIQKNPLVDDMHNILRSKGHGLAIITFSPLPTIPGAHFNNKTFGSVACSLGEDFDVHCNQEEFDIISRFFKLLMDTRWRRRTKNVFFRTKPFEELSCFIPPYFVACLAAAGRLDFQEMSKLLNESERSEAERIDAVRSTSNVVDLEQPRLWSPVRSSCFSSPGLHALF